MILLKPTKRLDSARIKFNLETARMRDFSDLLNFDALPGTFREKIMAVEDKLLLLPYTEYKMHHSFHDGVYLRSLYAPKNTLMTSYIYRKPHQCLISSGVVSYRSEVLRGKITTPVIFKADAGDKRIIFFHTDSIWTTIIKTDATNVADAEADIYLKSYEEWDAECCANIIEFWG